MAFDVERCIELHNAIIAHARSRMLDQNQPRFQRSWFTAHRIGLPALELFLGFTLDNDLRVFLEGIDIMVAEDHQKLSFTPFLVGISSLNELRPEAWDGPEGLDEEFILLYKDTDAGPGGLMMSRVTWQVCYVRDYFDDPRECLWGDLHVVLNLYMRCINSGKFFLDPDRLGWRFEGFTEAELTMALSMWDSLVAAIVAKLPTPPRGDEGEKIIPASVLAMYPTIPPFARAFLSQAKRPPFTYIAPQLQVPDEAFIHRVGSQLKESDPRASITTPQSDLIDYPYFLLFPWCTPGVQFASQDDADRWQSGRRSRILDNRAGLYLVPDIVHAHGSTLLLPFSLGSNGHVLIGDGAIVERPGQSVIYQHGICNPFIPNHNIPLAAILVNWWEQIENDFWSIDEHGVAGGQDLWRKADTEEDAEDFKTEWACF